MASVTDENRNTTIATINGLTTTGGTCIGKGLREGLNALKAFDEANGGVMILLTDGVYYCNGDGDISAILLNSDDTREGRQEPDHVERVTMMIILIVMVIYCQY